jgi:hypothetical protein
MARVLEGLGGGSHAGMHYTGGFAVFLFRTRCMDSVCFTLCWLCDRNPQDDGVYLLDDGTAFYIWIGHNAPASITDQLFGVVETVAVDFLSSATQ